MSPPHLWVPLAHFKLALRKPNGTTTRRTFCRRKVKSSSSGFLHPLSWVGGVREQWKAFLRKEATISPLPHLPHRRGKWVQAHHFDSLDWTSCWVGPLFPKGRLSLHCPGSSQTSCVSFLFSMVAEVGYCPRNPPSLCKPSHLALFSFPILCRKEKRFMTRDKSFFIWKLMCEGKENKSHSCFFLPQPNLQKPSPFQLESTLVINAMLLYFPFTTFITYNFIGRNAAIWGRILYSRAPCPKTTKECLIAW